MRTANESQDEEGYQGRGIVTIAIGIGPRTTPDIVDHAAIVAVLVCGLVAAARS